MNIQKIYKIKYKLNVNQYKKNLIIKLMYNIIFIKLGLIKIYKK